MNHHHPKPEYLMAGRRLCAAIIWGVCLLGSSPAVMPNVAGNGAANFGPNAVEAPDSTDGDQVAGDTSNTPEAAAKVPVYHPVPEPQTWVIAVSGLATLLVLQRLRRRPGMRRL